jgi:hypothetical protein
VQVLPLTAWLCVLLSHIAVVQVVLGQAAVMGPQQVPGPGWGPQQPVWTGHEERCTLNPLAW